MIRYNKDERQKQTASHNHITTYTHMKKNEIVSALQAMAAMNKADMSAAIEQLIVDLGPATTADPGKLVYFVTINDKVLDPAMKYPKQMLTCHDIIHEKAAGKTVSRSEILGWIGEEAEKLNTKQTPERIYAFYQKRMEDEGWLTRAKERVIA